MTSLKWLKNLAILEKELKRFYHLQLDKKLGALHLKKIQNGLVIDGKKVIPDKISYIENKDKSEIGIEVSIGGIKGVNQTFEQLGYNVSWIDRVFFAGLTKKDLPRKKYRFLSTDEINLLKRI